MTSSPLTRQEMAEVERFVHRVEHLRARTGVSDSYASELMMLSECWPITAWPVPGWPIELAEAGAPARQWCPTITPGLLDL